MNDSQGPVIQEVDRRLEMILLLKIGEGNRAAISKLRSHEHRKLASIS